MRLSVFFLVVVWPVVEIAVAVELAHRAGWGPVILAQLLLSLLGIVVLRSAGRHSRRAWSQLTSGTGVPKAAETADTGLRFLAGLLLFVPGFVSDAVGLLLTVPPVRALTMAVVGTTVARRSDSWVVLASRLRVGGQGDVIQGQVVREDQERPPGSTTPPALPGPGDS
jgi:UPF0716 protein FxsA